MQQWWWKMKAALARFMVGRHGVDQLTLALLYGGIALNLLSLIPFLRGLSLVALAMMVFGVYRVYSRNNVKRYQDNAWFLKLFGELPNKVRQGFTRMKNRRKYLYFDCPQCHAKLRLPRGAGDVTVTCGRCGHRVKKKA